MGQITLIRKRLRCRIVRVASFCLVLLGVGFLVPEVIEWVTVQ